MTAIATMSTAAMKTSMNFCLISLLAMDDKTLRAWSVNPENSLTYARRQGDIEEIEGR